MAYPENTFLILVIDKLENVKSKTYLIGQNDDKSYFELKMQSPDRHSRLQEIQVWRSEQQSKSILKKITLFN